MKNKLEDLRNHLFEALERISDPDLTEEQLAAETIKASHIDMIAKTIIDTAKVELNFIATLSDIGAHVNPSTFFPAIKAPEDVQQ